MRRRNREITTFSMSALDLFTSATGAFLLICLVALPYYLNRDVDLAQQVEELKSQAAELRQQNERLEAQTETCRRENEETRQRNEQLEAQNETCRRELAKTFLLVTLSWETRADLDLHVHTPSGNVYNYNNHNREDDQGRRRYNENAELSLDANASNPANGGIEVWRMIDAVPGRYQIRLHRYDRRQDTGPTPYSGLIFHRGGSHAFKGEISGNNIELRVTIVIDNGGNVSIQ